MVQSRPRKKVRQERTTQKNHINHHPLLLGRVKSIIIWCIVYKTKVYFHAIRAAIYYFWRLILVHSTQIGTNSWLVLYTTVNQFLLTLSAWVHRVFLAAAGRASYSLPPHPSLLYIFVDHLTSSAAFFLAFGPMMFSTDKWICKGNYGLLAGNTNRTTRGRRAPPSKSSRMQSKHNYEDDDVDRRLKQQPAACCSMLLALFYMHWRSSFDPATHVMCVYVCLECVMWSARNNPKRIIRHCHYSLITLSLSRAAVGVRAKYIPPERLSREARVANSSCFLIEICFYVTQWPHGFLPQSKCFGCTHGSFKARTFWQCPGWPPRWDMHQSRACSSLLLLPRSQWRERRTTLNN